MASFNLTAEDSSPMISYAPAGSWIDTPSGDPLSASYSAGTYHITSTQGATATITFTGTGLSIFGGHRANYGTYSVTVDGTTIVSSTAQSVDASARQLLGAVSDLSYGSHTAILTNTGGNPIDIDAIQFMGQVGQPGAVGVREILDDSSPAMTYSPSSAWQTSTSASYANGTLHFSQAPDASATFKFSGEAVALYGTVSPDHANMLVTVDGKSQVMPGGTGGMVSTLRPQVLLYYGSDLGAGEHTVVFAGDSQTAAAPFIDLDSVIVFKAAESPSTTPPTSSLPRASATGSTNSSPASSPSTPVTQRSMSTGAIAGAVLGGIIAFLLLLAVIGFLHLRRRRRQSNKIEKSMISVSPVLPMQADPKALEAGLATRGNVAFPFPPPKSISSSNARHSIAPSYYGSVAYEGIESEPPSRIGSIISSMSTAPLVSSVPMLAAPQPPPRSIPRKPAPASSGMGIGRPPARPSNRPPTMDFKEHGLAF